MRRLQILLVALALGAAVSARASQEDSARGSHPEPRLVGNWQLLSFVNIAADGSTRPARYDSGRIMYDAARNMAAQLMQSSREPVPPPATDEARSAAFRRYLGYYGKYTVDAPNGRVIHHVAGSSQPHWPGTDLIRYYTFSDDGNRLMLSVRNAERVTGTLTWEKLR